jgi:SAM-dependent methyltransferase
MKPPVTVGCRTRATGGVVRERGRATAQPELGQRNPDAIQGRARSIPGSKGRRQRTAGGARSFSAGDPARVVARTLQAFDGSVARATETHTAEVELALEATKWFAPGDRDRRHDSILEVIAGWRSRSLLEVGSGAGDFYARLRRRAPSVVAYTGVDLSPAMVALARRRFPGVDFRTSDVLRWPQTPVADVVTAVGVFALLVDRPEAHWKLMRALVRQMLALSRIGIVFDFYDFFTDEEASRPAEYFARELRRNDDTPIFCVRPLRLRRFAQQLGPVAMTRIYGVDGRVWRCVLRRGPLGHLPR